MKKRKGERISIRRTPDEFFYFVLKGLNTIYTPIDREEDFTGTVMIKILHRIELDKEYVDK